MIKWLLSTHLVTRLSIARLRTPRSDASVTQLCFECGYIYRLSFNANIFLNYTYLSDFSRSFTNCAPSPLLLQLYGCKQYASRYTKIFNKRRCICIFEISNHFSIYVRFYQFIVFCTLSMSFNNCNSDAIKRKVTGRCHMQLGLGCGWGKADVDILRNG